jgi:phosphopantothenoylcysteine decarboxylase/phosphopantothenate--cysteine ligase
MWNQPSTQRNMSLLESDGYQMIAPGEGWQACRTIGTGRLPEPDELVEALGRAVS